MCIVSNIGDDFSRRWEPKYPNWPAVPYPHPGDIRPFRPQSPEDIQEQFDKFLKPAAPQITKEDFDQLKRELESLKEVVKKAKLYDEITNQKDCEMEQKIAFIKRMAAEVGVDFDGVFETKKAKRPAKKKAAVKKKTK